MAIISGIVGLVKGGRKVWSAIKKPRPRVKATIKALGAAAGTVGSFAAADLLAGQMTRAMTGPAGLGGLPALPGLGAMGGGVPTPGLRAGEGGYLPEVIDKSLLRTYYRAPKGYVVVANRATGEVYAVRRDVARRLKLWKPAAKPPISATDYKHFKRNRIIEKKLRKIAGPIYKKHSSAATGGKKGRSK